MNKAHRLKAQLGKQDLWIRIPINVIMCLVKIIHEGMNVIPSYETRKF